MSLFARRALGDTPYNLVPSRLPQKTGSVIVSPDSALRSPAIWAALRLRADLVSTMPVDVFRRVGNVQVSCPIPPVLVNPGGEDVNIQEWLYSTQFELDRTGNAFGIISETDAIGKPRRIDLVPSASVIVMVDKVTSEIHYKIAGIVYPKSQIWHERQRTVPGLVMGLSPISYAAMTIGQYQSALEFGLEWFGNGGNIPGGIFKNTSKQVSATESDAIKTRFKAAVDGRDVLVTGSEWEYSTVNVQQNESQFLQTQEYSERSAAMFIGVPGDLIDVAPTGKTSLTYANITQRNLQFLIMNMGPAIARREAALSTWLPQPRYVKLNTDSLLRMDPDTRAAMFASQIMSKQRTPSEVRELDNLAPFTAAQIQEFEDLGIVAEAAPVAASAPVPNDIGESL